MMFNVNYTFYLSILFSCSKFSSGVATGTAILVEIPSDYGYVVLTGIASGILLAWQSIQV